MALVLVVSATTLLGPSTRASAAGSSPGSSSRTDAPLEASMTATSGTWVDLPMGDLDQSANTFWQLLHLAPKGSRWSLVTPPGFADNGGLVVAQAGASLISGFLASARIGFSPMAASSDGGQQWSPGILSGPLAVDPDALAGASDGRVLALGGKPATVVLSDRGGLSSWQRVVSARHLEASPAGRACDITALTAVSFSPDGQILVGTSCSRPGRVGVFEDSARGWAPAGPLLPGVVKSATTSVLRLRAFEGGVSALIATYSGGRTELYGSSLRGRSSWSTPVEVAITGGGQLKASGISADGGLVVLVKAAKGPVAECLAGGARAWLQLPRPPAQVSAISYEEGGRIDAFAVDHSRLTIYRLAETGSRWLRAQVMQVPIQYGSSS
ncbi:MAG: hypothetical protein ABSG36_16535 [Acidimicrobiales bacterium]